MKECSKSIARRLADANFVRRYFVGNGVDIGGKPDPLVLYSELFTGITSVKTWDLEDGDAQYMASAEDNFFDFVHSSHCLEHLVEPLTGIKNWFRILRPGGHLIVTVPDEDLYEQGQFPSTFNLDHKWTFTIYKPASWSSRSVNLIQLAMELGEAAELVRLELLSTTYRYGLPRYDQTLTPVGECGIEMVIRKRTAAEIVDKGRWRRPVSQPTREIRLHLNQHRDDMRMMKEANTGHPPFQNDSDL